MKCSNDAFDADMNTDGNKPESVVNLTGSRNGVLATAFAAFAVGVGWLWSQVTGPVSTRQHSSNAWHNKQENTSCTMPFPLAGSSRRCADSSHAWCGHCHGLCLSRSSLQVGLSVSIACMDSQQHRKHTYTILLPGKSKCVLQMEL